MTLSKAITRSKSPKQENFRVAKVEGTLRAETFLKKSIEPVILRHRTREDQDHTTKVCVFFM